MGNGLGLVLFILVVLFMANAFNRRNYPEELTQQAYMRQVESGNVILATILQNKETPTGQIVLRMKDGATYSLYVSDVTAEEAYLLEHNVEFTREDVPHESYLLSLVVPVAVSGIVLVIVFMMLNARMAGGGGGANAKMMNFGRGRAKLCERRRKIWRNWSISLRIPRNIPLWAPVSPRACCL